MNEIAEVLKWKLHSQGRKRETEREINEKETCLENAFASHYGLIRHLDEAVCTLQTHIFSVRLKANGDENDRTRQKTNWYRYWIEQNYCIISCFKLHGIHSNDGLRILVEFFVARRNGLLRSIFRCFGGVV